MRTAKAGRAVMCSGANLIVRRDAWLECEPLNVETKGEVYRLNVTFDKPRTVGGVAVLPKHATEKNFSVIAWIEDPVFAE